MDKYITMSQKEIKKYDIIKKLINKEFNGSEAAELLNLTTRHIRRLKKKVSKEGIKALIHSNRGNLVHSSRGSPAYRQTGSRLLQRRTDEVHNN